MPCEFIFRPIVQWPGLKTKRPKPAIFRSTYKKTLELLRKELRLLGVRSAVIQLDLPESKIRLDGLPYSNARPDGPGVILSFKSKYGPLQYAADTFNFWEDNLRAIALGLEALRKVDRYGITNRGEQYTGWKQLPAAINEIADERAAADFLARFSGLDAAAILADRSKVNPAFRLAARKLHPDKGGNAKDFDLLNKAKTLLENS